MGDEDDTATAILVPHADYTRELGNDDPGLNVAGVERAKALGRMLEHTGIDTILVSSFLRTRETAIPLADALDKPLTEVDDQDVDVAIDSVVAAIRDLPASSIVLVVGHSDTLPGVITGLGGPSIPEIHSDEFDRFYVQSGQRTTRLRYSA